MGSSLREDYLAKAMEADVLLQRATSRAEVDAWERIVVGYLELAELTVRPPLNS